MMEGQQEAGSFGRELVEIAARSIASGAGEELSALLGVGVVLTNRGIESVAAEAVADSDDPILVVLSRADGDPPLSVQLVVPRPLGATLAGLQQGRPLSELGSAGGEPLDPESRGALRAVLRIVVAAIQQSIGDQLGGALEIRDALEVDQPSSDPTWLLGSAFERVRFGVSIEGTESFMDVLFPSTSHEEEHEEVAGPRIVLIDDESESYDLHALGTALGGCVEASTSEQIRQGGLDGLLEAAAILIPWDVGGTPGIDLLERLAARRGTATTALLMTHRKPTRSMVLAALSAGATSFVMQPLVADELRERAGLGRGENRPPEEEIR